MNKGRLKDTSSQPRYESHIKITLRSCLPTLGASNYNSTSAFYLNPNFLMLCRAFFFVSATITHHNSSFYC